MPDLRNLMGNIQMTKSATKAVVSTATTETTYLAAAGQQMALDALRIEISAIAAMVPGLTASLANTPATDRQTRDAELEAMFDNMPL